MSVSNRLKRSASQAAELAADRYVQQLQVMEIFELVIQDHPVHSYISDAYYKLAPVRGAASALLFLWADILHRSSNSVSHRRLTDGMSSVPPQSLQ